MAERHRDVEALNRAARALLAADGTLTGPTLEVAGRQFQAGDEVVTLTQAGHTLIPAGRPTSAYIRTGTIGIITAVTLDAGNPAAQKITVYFPSKGTVDVPWAYLTHHFPDGRDGGLAHAYALTAAKAQGSTMDTARALVTDDTSRAGLYVMLSRARTDLAAYLIRRGDLDAKDDDETWLPATSSPGDPISRLSARLDHSQPDDDTTVRDPVAAAAHQLRVERTLAELTALRAGRPAPNRRADHPAPAVTALAGPTSGADPASHRRILASRDAPFAPDTPRRAKPDEPSQAGRPAPGRKSPAARGVPTKPRYGPGTPGAAADGGRGMANALPQQVLLRRAELAAEAAIRTAALTDPPARLVARIGPRPAAGPRRAVWDRAVSSLAIYHARHRPTAPNWSPGPPPGANPDDQIRDPWLVVRDQAVRLVHAWVASLPEAVRHRFAGPGETVPRARAIAGLHALLDAGYPANQLAAALNPDPVEHIRTAAAVLDHRVADLCRQAELDPALYDLPAPTTAQQEWNTITDLLAHAETNHLATSPTPDLAAERRNLTAAVARLADHSADAGLAAASQARVELESRLRRVEAALDRQSADALLHAKAEPASYLSALLGSRPPHDDAKAAEWDQAAGRVERYRHHVLGLPYGTPAQPDAMDPVHQALGDRPSHPTYAAEYDHAHDINSLNDGQLAL